MKKVLTIVLIIWAHISIFSQYNQAKVYWVGHSLISHTDFYTSGAQNLIQLMDVFATDQGTTYDYHQHTTPGAPIGYNWGANPDAWAYVSTVIDPLITATDPDYGTFDVMVVTESVDLHPAYFWWNSSFYARKFFNAAKNANQNTRLFIYESWVHYQASDDGYRPDYGPISTFDFNQYILDVRPLWEEIIDRASDPALTQFDSDYSYQGPGTDPGLGNDVLDIKVIPTGQVLIQVLERLALDLSVDDWTYNGSDLTNLDFFMNPLSNWPVDTISVVHPADPIDDIHPSNVLAYLNAIVHYAVIYQEDPTNLPLANGVPANIADIFKEVAWEVVLNDVRTGVALALPVVYVNPFQAMVDEDKVELSWSIIAELNNDYYEIERSVDGLNWQVIQIINSHKEGNTTKLYKVYDESPLNGTSFYRLIQVDNDGQYTTSEVQTIYFEKNEIEIYPNPVKDVVFIKFGNKGGVNYEILNPNGMVILRSNKSSIDVSSFPKGVYFIRMRGEIKKWIKN